MCIRDRVCVGLLALCAANPKGNDTPTEDPPADRTETGQWLSVEAYVQQVMLSQTEARYYAENADGTASGQPHTAACLLYTSLAADLPRHLQQHRCALADALHFFQILRRG